MLIASPRKVGLPNEIEYRAYLERLDYMQAEPNCCRPRRPQNDLKVPNDQIKEQTTSLESLVEEVRACRMCVERLPHQPRPVLQISSTARILIASQAPGAKVHSSGIPFADDSGKRLREWTGLSESEFYDPTEIAILPMGLCYPGRSTGGDAPPRPECAPLWRPRLLAQMPSIELTLLVGSYAMNHVLGPGKVADRVRAYLDYFPTYFPLPHPSWRSRIWTTKNP